MTNPTKLISETTIGSGDSGCFSMLLLIQNGADAKKIYAEIADRFGASAAVAETAFAEWQAMLHAREQACTRREQANHSQMLALEEKHAAINALITEPERVRVTSDPVAQKIIDELDAKLAKTAPKPLTA